MPPRHISFKALIYPHPKGTDHTPPTMGADMGDISTDHNPPAIPTTTGAAVSEGTHQAPHPGSTPVHATLQPVYAPITICTMTHPISIVTPHPTLTSPINITHTTIPQTKAGITPVTPTPLQGNAAKKSQAMPKTINPA